MQIAIDKTEADVEYDIIVHRIRDNWVIEQDEETHGE